MNREKVKVFILYDSGKTIILEKPIHEMKKIVKSNSVVLIESAETKTYTELVKKHENKIKELKAYQNTI